MRSVFLSLAVPLRLSQSDQRCCNWHWLSVSSISTTGRQVPSPPLPSSSSPALRPHSTCHVPRDAVFIIYTQGFSGLHDRGWPISFGLCPLAFVTRILADIQIYINNCTGLNCTHTQVQGNDSSLVHISPSPVCLLALGCCRHSDSCTDKTEGLCFTEDNFC